MGIPSCLSSFQFWQSVPCRRGKGFHCPDRFVSVGQIRVGRSVPNVLSGFSRPDTATEGDAWSFMGGYNLFRGEHASYNPILMNDILKGEWNWDGAVISDWGAVQIGRAHV